MAAYFQFYVQAVVIGALTRLLLLVAEIVGATLLILIVLDLLFGTGPGGDTRLSRLLGRLSRPHRQLSFRRRMHSIGPARSAPFLVRKRDTSASRAD